MFRFENAEMLYFLIALPVIIVIYYICNLRRKKDLRNLGDHYLMEQLAPDASISKPTIKFYLCIGALFCIIICLARPQFGFDKKEVKKDGIEMVVALDVSNSMNSRDMSGSANDPNAPSRLDVAKQIVSEVINKMNNDKIALIVFAGDAYMQVPLTADHISAKMFLSNITTASVARQGTAIGKALSLAMQSFGPQKEKGRAILVISDGENNEGDAVGAAKQAKERGVQVFTMGLGSSTGSPIPDLASQSFMKDKQGNIVMSKMNEDMLNEIAKSGGGEYLRGTDNSRSTANAIYSKLTNVDKKEMKSIIYENYEEYFQLLAAFAFVLLLLDLIILRGKSPLFKNFHLFK